MEIEPLQNDRYRVFLTTDELHQFFDCAPHHRAVPPFQLMALSLRVGVAAEVTPSQFFEKNGEHFLRVEGKDATDRYQETRPRNLWVPTPIYDEIQQFIEDQDIAEDESICDVGKRQLQNWVNQAADNAATATGMRDFAKVTAHDLRRFFGTHFLIRLQLDAQIVCQLGGWKSPENMYEYLLVPNDLLVHRLQKQGYTGTNPLSISGTDPTDALHANFDTIEQIITDADTSDVKAEAKQRLDDLLTEFDSLSLRVHESQSDAPATDTDDSVQSSLVSPDGETTDGFWAIDPTVFAYEIGATATEWLDRRFVRMCTEQFGMRPLAPVSRTRARRFTFGSLFLVILIAFTLGTGLLTDLITVDPVRLTLSPVEAFGIVLGLSFWLSSDHDYYCLLPKDNGR